MRASIASRVWASRARADLADRGCGERAEEERGAGARTGAGARPKRGSEYISANVAGVGGAPPRARARLTLEAHTRRAAGTEQVPVPGEWGGTARVVGTAPGGWRARDDARKGGRRVAGGGAGRVRSPTHHVPFSSSRVTASGETTACRLAGDPRRALPASREMTFPGGASSFRKSSVRRHGWENNAPAGHQATRGATYERTASHSCAHPRELSRPSFLRAVTRTPRLPYSARDLP